LQVDTHVRLVLIGYGDRGTASIVGDHPVPLFLVPQDSQVRPIREICRGLCWHSVIPDARLFISVGACRDGDDLEAIPSRLEWESSPGSLKTLQLRRELFLVAGPM
jgi:hypothetical protein